MTNNSLMQNDDNNYTIYKIIFFEYFLEKLKIKINLLWFESRK